MQGKAVALVAGSLLALSCALPARAQVDARRAMWDVEALAAQATGPIIDLTRQGARVAQVSTEQVRALADANQRLGVASGVAAKLLLTDLGAPAPNAFATRSNQGDLVVLNVAMLELMGDDLDALASVLGHEYAHIALNHRGARQEREQVMQGLGAILGLALSRGRGRTALRTTQFGTTAISRGFSRDEERAADAHGLRYAAAAGYSAQGGVRAWERMAARGNSVSLQFLATHPATEERLQSMRTLASSMPEVPREGVRIATAPGGIPEAASSPEGITSAALAPFEPAPANDGPLGIRAIAEAPEWPPPGVWAPKIVRTAPAP